MNTDSTFTLTLDLSTAWLIREYLRPGVEITWPPESAQAKVDVIVRSFRREVNNAILRLMDEEDLKTVDIDCTEGAAWAIDAQVSHDGSGGNGTALLVQVMRGLWHLDIGHIVSNTVKEAEDPHAGWSNTAFKDLQAPGNDDPTPV